MLSIDKAIEFFIILTSSPFKMNQVSNKMDPKFVSLEMSIQIDFRVA